MAIAKIVILAVLIVLLLIALIVVSLLHWNASGWTWLLGLAGGMKNAFILIILLLIVCLAVGFILGAI